MELILLRDVENVGKRGDVVNVRQGHGRNYLVPRKLAMAATRANRKFVEDQKVRAEKRRTREKEEALKRAKDIEKLKLTIESAAGDQDKLYGSITSEDICNSLSGKGYKLDKRRIHLKDPIRSLGTHDVSVELFPGVRAVVKIEVVRKA